ncbi:MAG TPA: acetylxylan esterase, partial [Gammaproteobacteria bacterium]|nr:acetylxylan esterase [Gammaproteobacteria bacterium]
WHVIETRHWRVGGRPVVGRQLIGRVNNSADPAISVDICMSLVTPEDARADVPVMIMFGSGTLPEAASQDDIAAEGGNTQSSGSSAGPGAEVEPAARRQARQAAQAVDPSSSLAAALSTCQRQASFLARLERRAASAESDPPATVQLIADGWGYASLSPTSIQADHGAGLTRGIIGLVNKGQRRRPDDWGALRAWAWGASRALDYLETQPGIDAKRVGIEGVSRYGKAALVTMAFDTRFAVVLVGSSGKGGAALYRRDFGEQVENLTGSGEYHWMAGNFLKYGASEGSVGSMNASDLPVDSHELIALCAPRPVFISYGIPEKGDAKWVDQQGSFMAEVAAQPVFRLLGAKGLGIADDYLHAKRPSVDVGLLNGQLAWRQHDGGHTDAPNWKYFIPWADRMFGRAAHTK